MGKGNYGWWNLMSINFLSRPEASRGRLQALWSNKLDPDLPLSLCVTLGKSLNLLASLFLYLACRGNSTDLIDMCEG